MCNKEIMYEVGDIRNYYGGLLIKKSGNKYYWKIEDPYSLEWEEIPESLHRELMRMNARRIEE